MGLILTPEALVILNRIKANPATAIKACEDFMQAASSCELLALLSEMTKPRYVSSLNSNYVNMEAAELNRCVGAHEILDVISMFRQLLISVNPTESVAPDYGALEATVTNDDLTKEEANAIRDHQPVPKLFAAKFSDFTAK